MIAHFLFCFRPRMDSDGEFVHRNNEPVLPFSEIDEQFVDQDFTTSHRHSCPSLSDFNTTAIKVCPAHRILDVDVNRLPVALYQVLFSPTSPVLHVGTCSYLKSPSVLFPHQ